MIRPGFPPAMNAKSLFLSLAMLAGAASLLALSSCDQPANNGGSGTAQAPVNPTAWTNFSGERAMEDVKALVAIGPRPSGSEGIEKSRGYIEQKLRDAGWETVRQEFEADTILRGKIKMANIRARFPVAGADTWSRNVTALACSHYDTKWFQSTVFVGANDGGSSTGLLLEIARATAPLKDFAASLELVFFDGEEAITGFTQPRGFNDSRFDGLFGSRHYAKELRKLPAESHPKFGIVFDIIGGEPLEVEFPDNCSKRLSSLALESANELNFNKHFRDAAVGAEMIDDHVPLSWLGLEVLNFISLGPFRSYWHTSADTIDKVFPKSIEITGRTGLHFMERSLRH
jgi:glutaminyl-peptide cyclotransferase